MNTSRVFTLSAGNAGVFDTHSGSRFGLAPCPSLSSHLWGLACTAQPLGWLGTALECQEGLSSQGDATEVLGSLGKSVPLEATAGAKALRPGARGFLEETPQGRVAGRVRWA